MLVRDVLRQNAIQHFVIFLPSGRSLWCRRSAVALVTRKEDRVSDTKVTFMLHTLVELFDFNESIKAFILPARSCRTSRRVLQDQVHMIEPARGLLQVNVARIFIFASAELQVLSSLPDVRVLQSNSRSLSVIYTGCFRTRFSCLSFQASFQLHRVEIGSRFRV